MTKSITLNYTIAVLAAFAMVFATAVPAFAAVNSSSITITTTNRGTIDNTTRASSHTGLNVAMGSLGGAGGMGGDVTSDGDNNNGGAESGNGGAGGSAAAGGLVTTGNATSDAGTANDLNGTDVGVDLLTAGGDVNSTAVAVDTDNDNIANNIDNTTRARSRSGENTAMGSTGGDAGDAGVIDGGAGDFNNGGAESGNGGVGGAGGVGGEVRTGHASSTSGTFNFLNTVMVRVRI